MPGAAVAALEAVTKVHGHQHEPDGPPDQRDCPPELYDRRQLDDRALGRDDGPVGPYDFHLVLDDHADGPLPTHDAVGLFAASQHESTNAHDTPTVSFSSWLFIPQ